MIKMKYRNDFDRAVLGVQDTAIKMAVIDVMDTASFVLKWARAEDYDLKQGELPALVEQILAREMARRDIENWDPFAD